VVRSFDITRVSRPQIQSEGSPCLGEHAVLGAKRKIDRKEPTQKLSPSLSSFCLLHHRKL
jgi:hypothetical protein